MTRDGPESNVNSADNQGRCCDAVLKILERRLGGRRQNLTFDTPHHPGVDIECEIAGRRFALEHTRIEPYQSKFREDLLVVEVFDWVVQRVTQERIVPATGYFLLCVNAGDGVSVKSSDFQRIREKILDWVRPHLEKIGFSGSPAIYRRSSDSVIPYEVMLKRVMDIGPGVLNGGRSVQPAFLAEWRRSRLATALDTKLPKLAVCQRDGAYAVLILENQDAALTDAAGVAQLVDARLAETNFKPDEIFQVDTFINNKWWVWTLRRGDLAWADLARNRVELVEYDPGNLADITSGQSGTSKHSS